MNANLTAIFRKTFAILRAQKASPEAWAKAREFARTGHQVFKQREELLMKAQAKRIRKITNRALDRIDWSRN